MIKVVLNGEEKSLANEKNLHEALVEWQQHNETFVIAVNDQFVPKDQYASTPIKSGDRIELLVPMQGG